MAEDYGASYISIEDDEGNEYELEYLDTFLYKEQEYMVFLPADMEEDDPDYGLIILRVEEEDGEDMLASVDDESEEEEIYNYYMENLFEKEEEELE